MNIKEDAVLSEYNIRKADEKDRKEIADLISECFFGDFSALAKDRKTLSRAIADGIVCEKFYLAEIGGTVAGMAACIDNQSRCVYTNIKTLRKNIGFIKGTVLKFMMRKDERPFAQPLDVANIEYVGVSEKARGRGIAYLLIKSILDAGEYSSYCLDVKDNNIPAVKTYEKLGFREYKREKQSFSKNEGFKELIYMRLDKQV